jgi:CheY-like chemotaxis protein
MADLLVLIAYDQPHVRLPLQFLIQALPGVKVMTASNGQEAVELALRHRPGLVLLDVMMPVMDGYTAAAKIREGWGDHGGQVWFLTARGSSMDSAQARAAGATQFINKPFDPDRLVGLLRQLLAARNENGAVAAVSTGQT